MFQKIFWDNAILYACHLINRMSSSVLHDKIPLYYLFPDKPTFSFALRVFDSCFFQNLKPKLDKLRTQSYKMCFY